MNKPIGRIIAAISIGMSVSGSVLAAKELRWNESQALKQTELKQLANSSSFELSPEKLFEPQKPSGPLVGVEHSTLEFELPEPGKSGRIHLVLPNTDVELYLRPVSEKRLGLAKGQFAWVARSEEVRDAFFMQINEGLEGYFTLGEYSYRLHSLDGKKARLSIFKMDRFKDAPNDGVISHEEIKKGKAGDSSCEDEPSQVDIMVLYTPATRDAAGGVADIENEIAFAVGRANLAFANSNTVHRLNLVYTGLANFTEPGAGVDSNTLLSDLAGTADGVLDTIHGLRDSVRADLVSLMYETDDSSWCGWGQVQQVADADTTDHRAFTVVQRSCAGGYLSFAHEVGHNMGALHDVSNTSGTNLGYNFGHIQPNPSDATVDPWRTVMSYGSPCSTTAGSSCERLPYFSNPGVNYSGDATGVTNSEDNVRVFENNDAEVSKYRCLRGSVGANVWMKDRWEDQGNEPEPATAGKAMWQSPYIWIRNSLDSSLEHEHEHENPILGTTNYVYVKLHNTGNASESANLELYYANASTNLNNPSNWNSIGTQAMSIVPGTDVAQFNWSGLPGAGHYCLLARWNTDGTPLAFTNIGDAVHGDNDLIWRNVNIIDLGGGDTKVHFNMAGARELEETYLLVTTKAISNQKVNWQELMEASIHLDKDVMKRAKIKSEGMKQTGRNEFQFTLDPRPKVIGPFRLKPSERKDVVMVTDVYEGAVKELIHSLDNPVYFDIGMIQISPEAVKMALENPEELYDHPGFVLGGVNYTVSVSPEK